MLNRKTLKTFRSEAGIDSLIKMMMTTSCKVADIHSDLAELKHRVYDRETELAQVEFPFSEEASQNGKNEAERKAKFVRLCMESETWQRVRQETDDALHHRDMMQAELDGLYARLGAQRTAANLITATLNASIE